MAEKEYIERETALKNIKETFLGASEFANDIRNAAMNAVNSVPTADVQEVVRCKDCKNAAVTFNNNFVCTILGKLMMPKDFCRYGAKMNGSEQE